MNSTAGPVPAGPLDEVSGSLTVRADSSLREVFQLLADQLERRHPNVDVRLQFSSSGALTSGDADVTASADRTRLDELQRRGSLGQATMFAQQVLSLAVAPGNPGRVSTLRDLRHPGVSVVVCEPAAPCGSSAQDLLDRAELELASPTRVSDTEVALRQLEEGKVDAGLVWASDLRGQSGRSARERGVLPVQLSADPQEDIRLAGAGSRDLFVATNASGNRSAAEAFVAQLRSSEGQQLLHADGYR